jgi:hypothetical protein
MRINFEANSAVVDLIEALQESTGATKKGVIVGALQLLKWSLDQQLAGRTIAAIDSDSDLVREYHSDLMLQGSG